MSSCQNFLLQTYREKGIEDVREDRRTHDKKDNPITEDVPVTEDVEISQKASLAKTSPEDEI